MINKKNIIELCAESGYTEEEFKKSIVEAFVAYCSMELEQNGTDMKISSLDHDDGIINIDVTKTY